MNSITLALQAQSTDMVAVRMLFDSALSKFPNQDEKSLCFSPDSEIVHSPHFEAGLVKIQDGRERDLCAQEKIACRALRFNKKSATDDAEAASAEKENDFATEILQNRVKVQKSEFMDTRFVLPTSNVAERVFSQYNDLRKSLLPFKLEEHMFLNRRFWDVKSVIDIVNQGLSSLIKIISNYSINCNQLIGNLCVQLN